ncbi:MAG TPA: type II toxin-antitoxin system death-on-curing family toxin [Blastocatellia bacterium]|nr:type II toxin-antitoxin system death-on-curing family toxin [Blastocatellia bacterium]
MRYLTIKRALYLHQLVIERSGGSHGLRDSGALESAVAQPRMTFDQMDLYPTLGAKAASLGYSIIQNHPFIDGNKRVGHAAMEAMLGLNGYEIAAPVDEQEQVILEVASGQRSREELTEWLEAHLVPMKSPSLE